MPCVSSSHPALRSAFVLAVYACITASSTVSGQSTQPASTDDDAIGVLLDKLASDDWAERHAAQSRLAAMAEAAEPRLRRAAQDSGDAEVRTRCNAALAQICEDRLIGPTLITLHGSAIDPQAACAELARQLDIAVEPRDRTLWDRTQPTLRIDADRAPLWDVVGQLRAQCGLDLEPAGGTRLAVVAVADAQRAAQTSNHGPFRVRAARIARAAAIDLLGGGGRVASTDFTITVMVQAEPKLSVARGSRTARLEFAEDENGVSLLPADDGPPTAAPRMTSGDTMRPGTAWWAAMGRLQYPGAGAGHRIARLRGSTSCALLVHSETIEVPDVLNARNVVKDLGGAPVTIKQCRRVGPANFEVQISGPRTLAGLDALRVFRGQATADGARLLLMPQGTELPLQGTRSNTSAQGLDVTLRFGAANAPADADLKLVWQVATDVRNVEIPFEFTDLPLP